MASQHYWDFHRRELQAALNKIYPNKRYIDLSDAEEKKIKRLASKIIKEGRLR